MPTVSIRKTLARAEGGYQADLTWAEVGQHFCEHYFDNAAEKTRIDAANERQRFYEGGGDNEMVVMINDLISNEKVRALRHACIKYAKIHNPCKRIPQEKGTVYLSPPTRRVKQERDSESYRQVVEKIELDERAQLLNYLLILHHAAAVIPRLEEAPTGDIVPALDIIHPGAFYAVRDPLNARVCVGLLLVLDTQLARGAKAPKYRFIGYHETFLLNSSGEVIEASVTEHGLGTMPAIFLQLDNSGGGLFDPNASADLVAAQKEIWGLLIFHFKEAKSATNQTIVTGDVSRDAVNQVDDTEVPIVLRDATVQVVDRSMDFSKFLDDADRIYAAVAANHGIPPELLRQGAVASAEARELLRAPLKELRVRQQPTFRRFERQLATLYALLLARESHPLAFNVDGFSIDFEDPQTVMGPMESLQVFETERRLNLTNTLDEIRRRNRDLTAEQAVDRLKLNIEEEILRNKLLRPLQQVSGSVTDPGDTPADGDEE
jgi:hypothetical protein